MTSKILFAHGEITKPSKMCVINNPSFKIVQFIKQGKQMSFYNQVCYLFSNEFIDEFKFAIEVGLRKYKSDSTIFLNRTIKPIVMDFLSRYPETKVYSSERPPLNLDLSFEENEFLIKKSPHVGTIEPTTYTITLKVKHSFKHEDNDADDSVKTKILILKSFELTYMHHNV